MFCAKSKIEIFYYQCINKQRNAQNQQGVLSKGHKKFKMHQMMNRPL